LLSLPFISLILWLVFSHNYNASANSVYFLTDIRPIWQLETRNIKEVWCRLSEDIIPNLFPIGILFFIGAAVFIMFLTSKRINKHLYFFNLAIIITLFLYVILWFANFDVHDYYLIELCLLIPPLFLSVAGFSKDQLMKHYQARSTKVLLVMILLFSITYSATSIRNRHNLTNPLADVILPEDEVKLFTWFHWNYDMKFKAYETIKPFLREELQIKREDLVISIPDPSPNISLFFTDQKGFTSLYQEGKSINEQLEFSINKGVKYLILNDTSVFRDEDFEKYQNNLIGVYKNIQVFKL